MGERGAALPLALMASALLAVLLVALSIMSATEPVIATNQMHAAHAQALAEAGIERALWAIQVGPAAGGLSHPLPTPVPAPYDGTRLIALSVGGRPSGGFRLTVSPGTAPSEIQVVAEGWMPTDDASDLRPKTQRRVEATLWRVRVPADLAPCALCVVGDLSLDDGAVLDARGDRRCGGKGGAWSSGALSMAPSAQIFGSDGNDSPNEAGDYDQGQPAEAARAWTFGEADLAALKRMARARGAYYQGSVIFDAASPAPDGLIFVDTTTGAPITDTLPLGDLARVEIRGGSFRGWLVVAGTLEVEGDARIRGLAYAQDGFTYRGGSLGGIEGQVVATGLRGGRTLLAQVGGGTALTFDCAAARDGDGTVSPGWRIKAGSYREAPGP
jgi:hypothetical protein